MNENTENKSAEVKEFKTSTDGETMLVVGTNLPALSHVLVFNYVPVSATPLTQRLLTDPMPISIGISWVTAYGLAKDEILPLLLYTAAHVVREIPASNNQITLSQSLIDWIMRNEMDPDGWLETMDLISNQNAHNRDHVYEIPYLRLAEWARDHDYVLLDKEPFDIEALKKAEEIEQGRQMSIEVTQHDVVGDLSQMDTMGVFDVRLKGISRELKGMESRVQLDTTLIKSDDGQVQLRSVDIDFVYDDGAVKLGKYLFALSVSAAVAVGRQIYGDEPFVIGLQQAPHPSVEPLLDAKPYNGTHRAMQPDWLMATMDYLKNEGFQIRPTA